MHSGVLRVRRVLRALRVHGVRRVPMGAPRVQRVHRELGVLLVDPLALRVKKVRLVPMVTLVPRARRVRMVHLVLQDPRAIRVRKGTTVHKGPKVLRARSVARLARRVPKVRLVLPMAPRVQRAHAG